MCLLLEGHWEGKVPKDSKPLAMLLAYVALRLASCHCTPTSTLLHLHPPTSPPSYISTLLHLHPPTSPPSYISTLLHLHPPTSPPSYISTLLHLHPPTSPPSYISTLLHLHPPTSPPSYISPSHTPHLWCEHPLCQHLTFEHCR